MMKKPGLLLLATLALAGCARTVSWRELDELNRSMSSTTIAIDPDVSIYSPFSPDRTAAYAALVREEMRAVGGLFEAVLDRPAVFRLVPLDGLSPKVRVVGSGVSVEFPRDHPLGGLQGMTTDDDVILVFVAAPKELEGSGGRYVVQVSEEESRRVIRHELAHAFLHRIGIRKKAWLHEAIAEEVESMELDGGRLRPRSLPENVDIAGRMARAKELPPLEEVLDIVQNLPRIARGEDGPLVWKRIEGHAFFRFYCEKRAGSGFLGAIAALDGLDRKGLLALEEEFQGWLRELPEGPLGRR